jgi:predicted adenylyl cyclase CyaB
MREVELKSVVPDPDRAIAALRAAGAVLALEGRLADSIYDTPDRALRSRGHVLRLREFTGVERSQASLDWKGPTTLADGYKVREELSCGIDSPDVLARLLTELGYALIGEIHRLISQFEYRGATVRFERYPRMDVLVEVEGEPAAIEAAIAGVGLPRAGFTPERLPEFARRFEARTGRRAALCDRELAGGYRYDSNA